MRAARILVVDDEESLRRVLQVQLENRGYETSLAKNGQEALAIGVASLQSQIVRHAENPPPKVCPRPSQLQMFEQSQENLLD